MKTHPTQSSTFNVRRWRFDVPLPRPSILHPLRAILALLLLFLCPAWVQAASTVRFTTSTGTVGEWAGSVSLAVQRINDTDTAVSVDYATADGSATAGAKYTATNGTLTFSAGETNRAIVVPILNEGFVEGTQTFQVLLSNPTNAVLGTPATATVSITDNDVGLQFQFPTYSVAEDAGTVLLGVVRGDDGELPVTVDLGTTNLTALSGLDYTGLTTNLAFGPTERLQLVAVPILNDSLKETASKTFRATLSNPVGATPGTLTTTTVTIVDNDQGFAFESATCSVAEDGGAALVSVLRGTDDTNSSATVDCATSDLTAVSGVDYTGITNTLAFAPGERVKVVPVPILNDGTGEPTKTFRLTLRNPTGGAVLGSQTTTTVSILDNDPGLGFELSRYTNAWENAADFTVIVLRGNDGALGPISVDYATSDLTATAGQDYQAVSGTLQFAGNETVKGLTIPLLSDGVVEGTESFRVTLSNPTGGAVLGTAITTVDILDASGLTAVTVAPPFDPALTIRRDWGVNLLTWAGGGTLRRADWLTGPWQTLTATQGPHTVQSPIPNSFYRVTRPRPVDLYIPPGYDGHTPLPLVILLHGYRLSGRLQESYMKFRPLAQARNFFYCYPDGTVDRGGKRFWNATDAACDWWNTGIDDAGYRLIEEIASRFSVDRKRVYLIGHSNGGFMSYRMACESADLIAGLASLAGTSFLDPSRCAPSEPVNILHIHGTADTFILYGGGATVVNPPYPANMPPYPGAEKAVRLWAEYNGAADPVTDPAPSLDLTTDVAGLDTVITRYTNCPPGGAVELWTINGGNHIPTLSPAFAPAIIDWLLAHPKP